MPRPRAPCVARAAWRSAPCAARPLRQREASPAPAAVQSQPGGPRSKAARCQCSKRPNRASARPWGCVRQASTASACLARTKRPEACKLPGEAGHAPQRHQHCQRRISIHPVHTPVAFPEPPGAALWVQACCKGASRPLQGVNTSNSAGLAGWKAPRAAQALDVLLSVYVRLSGRVQTASWRA